MVTHEVMNREAFEALKRRVEGAGFGHEIDFYESRCLEPPDRYAFLSEYMWVVINSGMKNQVARVINERIGAALAENRDISEAFGHKGKVAAIKEVGADLQRWFGGFEQAEDKVEYLETMPWIGGITKYHLAKNLGVDCVKPDRHLVRLARERETTPVELCQSLAGETGLRLATVDYVLWRAANLGWI